MSFPTPEFDAVGVGTSAPATGNITATGTITGGTIIGSTSAILSGATIAATGTITPSQTAGIVGTTTNNNANAGSVGEFVSAALASGSAISLTTVTPVNVVSVSLTAGDWDCQGQVSQTASVGASDMQVNITTTTAGITNGNNGGFAHLAISGASLGGNTINTGRVRFSLASTTTIFLVTQAAFASGTCTAFGFLSCRRVR